MSDFLQPQQIEEQSFAIITELLGDRVFPPDEEPVIKRVIHTTADFDYAENLTFSPDAVEKGVEALRSGCHIVTDTSMAMAGINKTALGRLGGRVHCFIADPDVAAEARTRGMTRSAVSMEKAAALDCPCIFAIGNAPTALMALDRLIKAGRVKPALVIGVPVGFVNVVESKERIIKSGVPHIVARGRKGGSNVAAAICNALIYEIGR
jgi:precorrin-8X/cobalt-precorrin-8 methylmutase